MKPGRQKRWVVREGDGTTVAEILKRAREEGSAVEEGRVFLGRARVKSGGERVRVGDEVRIGAGAGAGAGGRAGAGAGGRAGAGVAEEWRVIWERDGLLACAKPAGIPTVPDHMGSAHALVALAAKASARKVEELHVTSRLDREVSGVVVFATSAEAEARLRRAREEGRYARRYVAIAGGASIDGAGVWDAPIGGGKDARHRAAFGPDAKEAQTHWAEVARAGAYAILAVEPQTGRTHQIRVHASHAGAPLLGDRDYGGATRVTLPDGRVVALARIALHAARVVVPDSRGEPLVAEATIPEALTQAWSALGGVPEAWDTAVSCELER